MAAGPGVAEAEGVEFVSVFFGDFASVFGLGLFAWFVEFDFGGLAARGGTAGAVFHLFEAVAEAHCGSGWWRSDVMWRDLCSEGCWAEDDT